MDALTAIFERHTSADLSSAVDRAHLTTHIGNAPTQIFMVGPDTHGALLEVTAVIRHEDVLIVHATQMREGGKDLLDQVTADAGPAQEETDADFGRSADELVLTPSLVQELFDTADRGYDTERLYGRTRPGRPAPITVGTVVRVGLSEDEAHQLRALAQELGTSEAEIIAEAMDTLVSSIEISATAQKL